MKFKDLQEAIEWYIHECLLMGDKDGPFSTTCSVIAEEYIPSGNLGESDGGRTAKLDIELALMAIGKGDKAERLRAAVYIYGLMGYYHAAYFYSLELGVEDVAPYQIHCNRDTDDPLLVQRYKTMGWELDPKYAAICHKEAPRDESGRKPLTKCLNGIERRLAAAGYLPRDIVEDEPTETVKPTFVWIDPQILSSL